MATRAPTRAASSARLNSSLVKRTIVLDVVQGILVGARLAILTAILLITAQFNALQTTVNGWSIALQCGEASNGILLKAACASHLPMTNTQGHLVAYASSCYSVGDRSSLVRAPSAWCWGQAQCSDRP
jgi:hypothetical protein